MRLLVVNPNSTEAMTASIAAAARAAAAPDVEIVAVTNASGPPAIQGEADGALAVPGAVAAIRRGASEGCAAAIIACFDDTGLDEARAAVPIPVIGIGEAGFHVAMLHGGPFSVITTLPVSVPVIEANLRRYGLEAACARVRASGLAVLELDEAPARAEPILIDCARAALAEDGARALVLGCGGMAPYAEALRAATGAKVVDGVAAATDLARAAAR